MTRIRYTLSENGKLVSKPIMANRGTVTLSIDPNTFTLTIVSFDTGEVLETFAGQSLAKVKIHAKMRVAELGAVFSEEARTHRSEEVTSEVAQEAS